MAVMPYKPVTWKEEIMPVGWNIKKPGLKKVDALIADLESEKDKLFEKAGKIALNLSIGVLADVKAQYNIVKAKLDLLQSVRAAILSDTDEVW
jgi:hypothetical protein